ncbi:Trissin receptor [Carabus blaptoides fortunei]
MQEYIDLNISSTLTTNSSLIFYNGSWNNASDPASPDEYLFDRTDVRVIFITLYTIVFCCCFFGNLLVILVVTLSRRLRSITNFFLANLAVADLCVGVFCVFQNLSMYLIPTWVLGNFLCKMYQFVHSLSYTASIFILVVICTERYFAIIHPITCKQILTPTRLRMVIILVWITSAVYSAPRFIWVETIVNNMRNGGSETICATHRKKYNSELFDMINFVLLYVVPLVVMTVLYTRIAVGLWRSSRQLEKHWNMNTNDKQLHQQAQPNNIPECNHTCAGAHTYQQHPTAIRYKQPSLNTKFVTECKPVVTSSGFSVQHPNSSQNVLRARRGVIRMLIVVVLTFALCNLPFHARKMWQYWSTGYRGSSDFSTLFTPLTFLITYFNSGVNPLLYAFLSRNFRRGMREILLCSLRGSSSQRDPVHKLHNITATGRSGGYLNRHASSRSTMKANATTVTITNNASSDAYNEEEL